MFIIAIFLGGMCLLFGVVYPVMMIVLHKLCGGKLTVKEILERI